MEVLVLLLVRHKKALKIKSNLQKKNSTKDRKRSEKKIEQYKNKRQGWKIVGVCETFTL
jgi:hypothetical protein